MALLKKTDFNESSQQSFASLDLTDANTLAQMLSVAEQLYLSGDWTIHGLNRTRAWIADLAIE
jgi:hypothetical protein